MPIKLPKGFARRKSSGNVLDEVDGQPQSSFRVFERPGTQQRSMTDGAPLTKRMSEGHASLEDADNIFAGSEHPLGKTRYDRPRTMESLRKRLTGRNDSGPTYESSTSTRLSSSSTLPSSTEVPPPDEASSPHSRIHDIPAPPPLAGALRAAGRTFSFGGRFNKNSTPPAPPRHATPDVPKQRAYSGSTDDTATPPRLPDSQLNFDLGAGEDDFGKMFDHLGKRQSALLRDSSPQRTKQYSSSPPTQALAEFQVTDSRAGRPTPINTDRSVAVEPSPYSWGSRHSGDNLLNSPSGEKVTSPARSTPETVTSFRKPSPSPAQMLGATTSHRALEKPGRRPSDGLRRSGIYPVDQDSHAIDDEDAKMVRQSVLWTKGSSPRWEEATSPSGETPLLDKGKATSPSHLSPTGDENLFAPRRSPAPSDNGLDDARLAVQFAESLPKSASPANGNKVMTPSQFEHYRQQQELRRSKSDATKSDEGSEHEEFEDEEDEVEKQRAAERQRRKQEAHLSLYRQQMQKVTGQQAPSPMLRPEMAGASSSTPNLPNRLSNPGDKSSSGKSSNEDDEEIPLGILAAHGFPNRNRPPTRLANVSSHPNLRASMHPYSASSTSLAGAEAGNRGSLPVFARNLPQDPYFGARIVNPSNRESLALGGGSGSVYGGASSPVPPPGGLVGVIATEERNRAARRAGGGSPNPMAMYEQMQMGMGSPGGVPRPYSMMGPQPMTPSEQAQVNLSNQMQNMMQMQMQWMGQMMQMQGMQGMPQGMPGTPPMMAGGMPPQMMGGMPMQGGPMGPPSVMGVNPNLRPMSMQGPPGAMAPNFEQQRTLSMLDPNIAARRGSPMPNLPAGPPFRPNNTGGYAPSIAPSERSNAGLASRYRPVSVMAGEPGPGVTPMNKWNDENQHHSSLSVSQSHMGLPKSSSLATVTVRPVSRTSQSPAGRKPPASDEEDDDEGWADMMKKRDKKKSSWKLKRGTSSLGDLLSAVH